MIFAAVDSYRNEDKQFKYIDVLVAIPIVLIAYIAGYLTGISGSSAIGNLVPAVLAFIGGLNVYMFGAKVDQRSLIIFSIFLFAIILFYGVLDGRYDRESSIEALRGSLWVTIDNDRRDIVVEPGAGFRVDRAGGALISAMDDADFVLLEAGSAAHAG